MGAVSSHFSGKLTSQIESDSFEAPSVVVKSMAEANYPRDAHTAIQHTGRPCFSREEVNRYSNALQTCHEFLTNSLSLVERQRLLETELDTCHDRLRRFTEDHARLSESVNENISSSNRPSALERNYEQFYDHERMDAIDCIEKSRIKKEVTKWSEIEDQRVACVVFEEAFKAAQTLKESFLEGISCMMKSAPAIGAQYSEGKSDPVVFSVKRDQRQPSSLGQSDLNNLKAILKETAESCDIDAIIKKVHDSLSHRQEKGRLSDYTKDLFCKKEMVRYLEKCCRYAWKMVCQTPPYLIKGNSVTLKSDAVFDSAYHQVPREYGEYNSGLICMVLWPGLIEGSSGRVVRKTEVVLK